MPGIVDDLVAPELARMVGDDLIVEQHDDPLGMERTRTIRPAARASTL